VQCRLRHDRCAPSTPTPSSAAREDTLKHIISELEVRVQNELRAQADAKKRLHNSRASDEVSINLHQNVHFSNLYNANTHVYSLSPPTDPPGSQGS
jgi:hypothetical protein